MGPNKNLFIIFLKTNCNLLYLLHGEDKQQQIHLLLQVAQYLKLFIQRKIIILDGMVNTIMFIQRKVIILDGMVKREKHLNIFVLDAG